MSVSMAKADGVTVFTLTFDPQSNLPPICQICKVLCCSPVFCSVSKHLQSLHSRSQTVLGALHIMVGLLNIGLGSILLCSGGASGWQMDDTMFPIWLGILFVVFGVTCIVSERFPSPCLVSVNIILNVAGLAFAITAIVLYSVNMADVWMGWMCSDDYEPRGGRLSSFQNHDEIREKCLEGQRLALMLSRCINGLLIVLSVMELCVSISCVVLGAKALANDRKALKEVTAQPELYKPLLEEVTSD